MNFHAHPVTQGVVNHPMLLNHPLADKLRRGNFDLKMVSAARRVRHPQLRTGEGSSQGCFDERLHDRSRADNGVSAK